MTKKEIALEAIRLLKIEDPDSSEKISYIKGTSNIEGITHLKEKVDSGEAKAGFGIYGAGSKDPGCGPGTPYGSRRR